MCKGFEQRKLGDDGLLFEGRLPEELVPLAAAFQELWDMHPAEFHEIRMGGRRVKSPRWQQAYGRNYFFAGSVNKALPVTENLAPFLVWARSSIDTRLNGLLLNWYDASFRHYIGRHRDEVRGLIEGAPIVTISLGAERAFRLRPWHREGDLVDLRAVNGTVFVVPFATNRSWTHEVPHNAQSAGRRLSVTIRAFRDDDW